MSVVTSLFDRLGGEARLRPLIQEFVNEMVNDTMIGFFFRGVDRDRLADLEYQFTARFLGADVNYEGRPIGRAHRAHPIMGGQFDRRRRILEETLIRHDVAPEHRAAWLAHVDALRKVVTQDGRGECHDQGDAPSEAPSPFRVIDRDG